MLAVPYRDLSTPTAHDCNANAFPDFGLAQIFPLADDESDAEPAKVVSASFADPYVLLIRDDLSAILLTEDESGDLDEVARGEAFRRGKWLSGSLFEDSNDILRLEYPEESDDEAGNVLLFLLTAVGGLQVREISSTITIPLNFRLSRAKYQSCCFG